MRRIILSLCCWLLAATSVQAAERINVPEPLQPWVPWVLQDQKTKTCSMLPGSTRRHCLWPSELRLDLTATGGTFDQQWLVEAPDWILLPGKKIWPTGVTVDGHRNEVLSRQGHPAIRIEKKGSYQVQGHFKWTSLPRSLTLPSGTGLVRLQVNGRERPFPRRQGTTLWLGEGNNQLRAVRDELHIQVARRINDLVPMQILTRIELQVAGRQRLVTLGWQTPETQVPVKIDSPMPARLVNGRLQLQLQPGNWIINYLTRSRRPVERLQIGNTDGGPWPTTEYWSFLAHPDLRLVKIKGPRPVDPSQIDLPPEWASLPTYRMESGNSMIFHLIRRGDSDPPPDQLTMQRTIWLDDSGRGFTFLDHLQGTINSGWRLEMVPDIRLGRVTVDGIDRLITRMQGRKSAGVELRRGNLEMESVSRYSRGTVLPAVGWNRDMHSLSASLRLPPGWRLLHIRGVDEARTWLTRWTLLDLFMVLITVLAVTRLMGWWQGGVTLLTLVCIYHEPGAPRLIWLLLPGAIALLRALPAGRARQMIRGLRYLLCAFLLLSAMPFVIRELRTSLYPQLLAGPVQEELVTNETMPAMDQELSMDKSSRGMPGRARKSMALAPTPVSSSYGYEQLDADTAKIQTGPGLPAWQGRSVQLSWNGPVARDQKIRLVLLSPHANLVLTWSAMGLLLLLIAILFEIRLPRLPGRNHSVMAAVLVAALCLLWGNTGRAADFPDRQLLDELRQRLLKNPVCAPDCSTIERLDLQAAGDRLTLTLRIHAGSPTSVPLPDGPAWSIVGVRENDRPVPVLRQKDRLLIPVEQGIHQIRLLARLHPVDEVPLLLPMVPHHVHLRPGSDWTLEGVDDNNIPTGAQLRLIRVLPAGDKEKQATWQVSLPSLIQIHRTVELGVRWQVETVVERLSPPGTPVFLNIPLLEGESVTTAGIEVRRKQAGIHLAANQTRLTYRGVLEKRQSLTLHAPDSDRWFEIWELRASPMYHVKSTGLVVTRWQQQGAWQPLWFPWPGESVQWTISRPPGIEGPTRTIDRSLLQVKPGLRNLDMALHLTIRSARADQEVLTLPEEAILQSVHINGQQQPLRLNQNELTLPLTPGSMTVDIAWQQPRTLSWLWRVPPVDLHMASVNATVEVRPGSRWIWFVRGPRLGPAILFYSELALVVLAAILLGLSGWTPLRTWHWLLLGIGLCQSGLAVSALLVGWFLALELRRRKAKVLQDAPFNLAQVFLVLLTLAAFAGLVYAVQNGLLGQPDMRISGNGSCNHLLRWYHDRVAGSLPQPLLLSWPLLAYRLTMLAWAIWLAAMLLRWVFWGWQAFSSEGLWRKVAIQRKQEHGGQGTEDGNQTD